MILRLLCLSITLLFLFENLSAQSPKIEFRGAWIATVANIDWPSRAGLNSDQQKAEYVDILNSHQELGINAVIVQVRPAADAFYPSRYEPWSRWLTGKINRAPDPYYDPLTFMIEEAHARGMEFHAWFNPYRALVNGNKQHADSASLVFQKPEWFIQYGKNVYFNPGLPEAREHVVNVIMEVVNKYNVDGIHFDDYFYPYKILNEEFPDSLEYKEFGKDFHSIGNWRRSNVDALIHQLHDSISRVKPYVKFGISPFGVWRNASVDSTGSATRAGQTCYDDLYADVLKWLKEGWIDYVAPQIYWSIGFAAADYKILIDWWNKNNFGKPVLIGQAAYKVGNDKDNRWSDSLEITRQIDLNRVNSSIAGSIFFSSKSLVKNPLEIRKLLKSYYGLPAVTPGKVYPYPADTIDRQLTFTASDSSISLGWNESLSEVALGSSSRYIIYRYRAGDEIKLEESKSILSILPASNYRAPAYHRFVDYSAKRGKKYTYLVSVIDRFGNEQFPKNSFTVKYTRKYWKTYSSNKATGNK